MNKDLRLIGESPVNKDKVSHKLYSVAKIENISTALSENIFHTSFDVSDPSVVEEDGNSIIQVLKDELNTTKDHAKQIPMLTIFKDWSFRKITHHFSSAMFHMIRVSKKTATNLGVLAVPGPKKYPSLEKEVIDLIVSFYELDENSRMLPGKKDFVSVKVNNKRLHMQKRLLLINLKKLYQLFKEKHPEVKCSFSKFAALRPKHCVLAGATGTHSVCVCAIHDNVKLLIDGPNIEKLTVDLPDPIKSYHGCLNRIICAEETTDCYFGTCSECPGVTQLIDESENIFDCNSINEITYRQWINDDRTTLQVLISLVDEYLQIFKTGLEKLLLHSYLERKQNEFMNITKEKLTENECFVVCDFSGNYAFVVQNSVQGIHWNNNQATVHPFAIYHKNLDSGRMKSFVIISECLHHDTIAVHVFQKYLVQFFKKTLKQI